MKLQGVSQSGNGKYFLESPTTVEVPVAKESTGYRLSKEMIDEWFGITKNLPKLPKFLIMEETQCTKIGQNAGQGFNRWILGPAWTGFEAAINGGWGVYQPVEWVPTAELVQIIPKSKLTTEYKRTTTKIDKKRLYAGLKGTSTASVGGSYAGCKLEASLEVTGETSIELTTDTVEEQITSGTLGDKAVAEIALGINIKLERVYSWDFPENDVKFDYSFYPLDHPMTNAKNLRWSGPTDKTNTISDHQLSQVSKLQYEKFGLKMQVLFTTKNNSVDKLYVAMRASDGHSWFVYDSPYGSPVQGPESGLYITMAWTGIDPLATLMTIE